jgi:alkylhydroperoxidase family enzyme
LFIDPIDPDSAQGLTAEIYRSEIEGRGFLPEFVQTFSHHPEAYKAWQTLITVLYGGMDRRRCELATLAAARTMKSTGCTVAHGKTLRDRFFTADEVVQIMEDHDRPSRVGSARSVELAELLSPGGLHQPVRGGCNGK